MGLQVLASKMGLGRVLPRLQLCSAPPTRTVKMPGRGLGDQLSNRHSIPSLEAAGRGPGLLSSAHAPLATWPLPRAPCRCGLTAEECARLAGEDPTPRRSRVRVFQTGMWTARPGGSAAILGSCSSKHDYRAKK